MNEIKPSWVYKQKAKIIQNIRKYLDRRGFFEVTTPILVKTPSGSENSLPIKVNGLYLRTCPEVKLKEIMASGINRIYEIGKSFRQESEDATHVSEFTLMEIYQKDGLLTDVMDLNYKLINNLTNYRWGKKTDHENPRNNWLTITYKQAIEKYGEDFGKHLIQPTFVINFPVEKSPYAKTNYAWANSDFQSAKRFELYIDGIEIANFYEAITDWKEQEQRLKDCANLVPHDEELIEILKNNNFPSQLVGGGIGIDRLLMIINKKDNIKDVI